MDDYPSEDDSFVSKPSTPLRSLARQTPRSAPDRGGAHHGAGHGGASLSVHGGCRYGCSGPSGSSGSGGSLLPSTSKLPPRRSRSPPLTSTGDAKVDAYRKEYRSYRRGFARGAKGELTDIAKRSVRMSIDTLNLQPSGAQMRHRRTNSGGGETRLADLRRERLSN